MAATVVVRKRTKFLGSFAVIADITLDSSYVTGGEPVTASQFGLETLEFVQVPHVVGARLVEFVHASNKVKAYSALGTEIANATDLSAVVIRVLAIGY